MTTTTIETVYVQTVAAPPCPGGGSGCPPPIYKNYGEFISPQAKDSGVTGNSFDHSTEYGQQVSTMATFLAHSPP